MMYYAQMQSPIGVLLLTATDQALTGIHFEGSHPAIGDDWIQRSDHAVLGRAQKQLKEYFDGKRKTFDLPLAPTGTDFQRKVWKALKSIPWGETQSYGDIARRIQNPKAVRAVGAANGANPIPIVVPCHRVIGSNGALTGFGGGLWRKKKLLALEQAAGQASF